VHRGKDSLVKMARQAALSDTAIKEVTRAMNRAGNRLRSGQPGSGLVNKDTIMPWMHSLDGIDGGERDVFQQMLTDVGGLGHGTPTEDMMDTYSRVVTIVNGYVPQGLESLRMTRIGTAADVVVRESSLGFCNEIASELNSRLNPNADNVGGGTLKGAAAAYRTASKVPALKLEVLLNRTFPKLSEAGKWGTAPGD